MTLATQVDLEDAGTAARDDHSRTPPEHPHDQQNHSIQQSSGNGHQIYSTLTAQRYIMRPELYSSKEDLNDANYGTGIRVSAIYWYLTHFFTRKILRIFPYILKRI